jgi:hypothetical protein
MANTCSGGVTVTALAHDLTRKQSFVTLVWNGDPEKKVVLPVPFGCGLNDVQAQAEKAMRSLSAEIATIEVKKAE